MGGGYEFRFVHRWIGIFAGGAQITFTMTKLRDHKVWMKKAQKAATEKIKRNTFLYSNKLREKRRRSQPFR